MAELVSTRDPHAEVIGYDDAILDGLAPDRGLYTPFNGVYPHFTTGELRGLTDRSYGERATAVKRKLIAGDIPEDVQARLNNEAYATGFSASNDGDIAPLLEIGDRLFVKDLSLGPTAAFKDFGMHSAAPEMDYVLSLTDEDLEILGASSGDTISAAEAGFGAFERFRMFMLVPKQSNMTPFQMAQAGVLSSERIHNIKFNGTFDDCQDAVKQLKGEKEFSKMGAVNSINWGRIVGQVVYYFDGYLQAVGDKIGEPVDFVVPTGNFGNILSGHVARHMGLPIRNLVVATNENNVMHRLIQTGDYERGKGKNTSSPSMDITKASNYERLVYEIFAGDPRVVRGYMREFELSGKVSLSDYGVGKKVFELLGIKSGSSDHKGRLAAMRKTFNDSGIVIDPHTADAVSVALQKDLGLDGVKAICLGTAGAVKSEPVIEEAGLPVPQREERFQELENHPDADNYVDIDSIGALRKYIRENL